MSQVSHHVIVLLALLFLLGTFLLQLHFLELEPLLIDSFVLLPLILGHLELFLLLRSILFKLTDALLVLLLVLKFVFIRACYILFVLFL